MRRNVSCVIELEQHRDMPLTLTFTVEPETAPSGMLGRGHYEATSRFIDDDKQTHLEFKWAFDIKKDW